MIDCWETASHWLERDDKKYDRAPQRRMIELKTGNFWPEKKRNHMLGVGVDTFVDMLGVECRPQTHQRPRRALNNNTRAQLQCRLLSTCGKNVAQVWNGWSETLCTLFLHKLIMSCSCLWIKNLHQSGRGQVACHVTHFKIFGTSIYLDLMKPGTLKLVHSWTVAITSSWKGGVVRVMWPHIEVFGPAVVIDRSHLGNSNFIHKLCPTVAFRSKPSRTFPHPRPRNIMDVINTKIQKKSAIHHYE